MARPVYRMLYHKEYAPRGRKFDMNHHSLDALVKQGYVDNPAKIGVNPWGPDAADRVKEIERSYERGEVEAIGPTKVSQHNPEMELHELERERLHEQLLRQEEEIKHLRKMADEKKHDLRSDGAKIKEKKADIQSQVPADEPAPKKRGRPRKETPVETAVPETASDDTEL